MAGDRTLLDELLAVQRELAQAPTDAFALRIELRNRLNSLQAALAAAGPEVQDESTLLGYLKQLEHRRDVLLAQRIVPSTQGRGISRKQADEFDRRIDQASDLPALEKEIAQVRSRLAAHRRADS